MRKTKREMAQHIKSEHPNPDALYCEYILFGLMDLKYADLKELYDECPDENDQYEV